MTVVDLECLECSDWYYLDPLERRNSQRCGWCIVHDHRNCRVNVEMGIDARAGRPKKNAKEKAYSWRCGCTCGFSKQSRCLDCLRRDVEVDEKSRCADRKACERWVGRVRQPPARQNREL